MRRALLISAVVLSAAVFTTSQAMAFQCPKLIKQIEEETSNRLDDGCMASPAAVGKSLFLRTKTHLYCIEKK